MHDLTQGRPMRIQSHLLSHILAYMNMQTCRHIRAHTLMRMHTTMHVAIASVYVHSHANTDVCRYSRNQTHACAYLHTHAHAVTFMYAYSCTLPHTQSLTHAHPFTHTHMFTLVAITHTHVFAYSNMNTHIHAYACDFTLTCTRMTCIQSNANIRPIPRIIRIVTVCTSTGYLRKSVCYIDMPVHFAHSWRGNSCWWRLNDTNIQC